MHQVYRLQKRESLLINNLTNVNGGFKGSRGYYVLVYRFEVNEINIL